MSERLYAFQPEKATVVTISATATTVPFVTSALHYRIVNRTSGFIHFLVGNSAISASTTDFISVPNSAEVFRRNPQNDTHISIRTVTGTGSANVEEGLGI